MKSFIFIFIFAGFPNVIHNITDIFQPSTFTIKCDDVYEESNDITITIAITNILYAEAELYKDLYVFGVLDVFYNRVNDKRFPNTIGSVLYHHGQFDGKFETGYAQCGTPRYAELYIMVHEYNEMQLNCNYNPKVLPSKKYCHYFNREQSGDKKFVRDMDKFYQIKLGLHTFVNY